MLSQVKTMNGYQISETDVIRAQDHKRYAVTKPGARKPYVVTFQFCGSAACSCPAGCNQKSCKHVAMVRSTFYH